MNIAPLQAKQTMTSAQLAELLGRRIDKMNQSIALLVEKNVIQPAVAEDGYILSKRDTYVVVAHLSPEFTAALVDRWTYLESLVHARTINSVQHKHMVTFEDAARLVGRKPTGAFWDTVAAAIAHWRSLGVTDQTEGDFYRDNFKVSIFIVGLLVANRHFKPKEIPHAMAPFLERQRRDLVIQ